ncbi:DMT family transporter [Marinobacter alexandrii]|jgi:drug/metabolite transporter (DMT)-like permease|uniref:DMT family transporter n=1 Tax=Marinobacter alexandrii TaxID=2570351 RepID=UPI002ABE07BE|nr:DMT family transporter [Marinobacter alexandrii]
MTRHLRSRQRPLLLISGFATVLANAQPLFAAVLSFFIIREVVTGRLFAGLLIGFVGVVVLATPEMEFGNARFAGVVYVLGGAIGAAIGNVLLKYQAGSDDIYWPMGIQLFIEADSLVRQ